MHSTRSLQSSTIVEILHGRAADEADRCAYSFLVNGEDLGASLTYRELDSRARSLATELHRLEAGKGKRALLLFPPGLDFISAFFGCLYAGTVAVPAYPPRLNRSSDRLRAISRDSEPSVVLTTKGIADRFHSRLLSEPELAGIPWIAVDDLDSTGAEEWKPVPLDASDLAFLQYTSGSTGTPKGVEVRHGNLLHNEEMIRRAFDQSSESVIVGWLPLYHDMGLIGNVLQPLHVGAPCVLMSPLSFLQRPRRWLEAISRFRGTTSGGPNFAYDLCVQKVGGTDLEGLDLSSWRVAFNGAEPVRAETLERFAATFEVCGFSRRAFFPCYGLAEGTLFVTGGTVAGGAVTGRFAEAALERHRGEADPKGLELVSSGRTGLDQEVLVVDAETCARLPEGRVGEIWVRGPSIPAGYWRQEKESRATFGARIAGESDASYLRTGDLGFANDGELFVTGRIKDLIILRGRNLYPQDLERTVETAHEELRPGSCAALSADIDGAERLVVVAEVERRTTSSVVTVAEAVRAKVAEEHEASVFEVVLIRVGTIPRTSSGKIRRHACRHGYLEGTLKVVGQSRMSGVPAEVAASTRVDLLALSEGERRPFLLSFLLAETSTALGRTPAPGQSLLELGLDSLAAVDLQVRMEDLLGVAATAAEILDGLDLESLTDLLLARWEATEGKTSEIRRQGDGLGDHPASEGQRAFWLQTALAPGSGAWNVAAAALVRPSNDEPLEPASLRRALEALVRRHGALRTTFRSEGSEILQVVHETLPPELSTIDAVGWTEERFDAELAQEADRSFDLKAGPLVRAKLYLRPADDAVLLLVVHHAVTDLWSMGILLEELGLLYDEAMGTGGGPPPVRGPRASDVTRWLNSRLVGAEAERLRSFWIRELVGETDAPLPVLALATDRPRPAVQTFHGLRVHSQFDLPLVADLKGFGARRGSTPYVTLLASFQALLHRLSHQLDLVVGSPVSGRGRRELESVVGYLVNMVALRSQLARATTFAEFTEASRRRVLGALAHQDYPFSRLAEELRPVRDPGRSPIFQAAFVLQGAVGAHGLGPFSLGHGGTCLRTGGLELESRALEVLSCQFELTLSAAEFSGGMALTLLVNADLFDRSTAERLLASYEVLLRAALQSPEAAAGSLPVVSGTEALQIATHSRPAARFSIADSLVDRFSRQVALTPEAPAVSWTRPDSIKGDLTYAELDRRSREVATSLVQLGVNLEDRVGLLEDRGPDLIVGALGILKAGGAYVPLDLAHPKERLQHVVEDAGITVLVTRNQWLDHLPDSAAASGPRLLLTDRPIGALPGERPGFVLPEVHSQNTAYVIYTSGSTGKPKGVPVSHENVLRLFDATQEGFRFGPDDVWTLFHAFTFDFSVWELWGPLLSGGRLVIVPYSVSRSPEQFLALLEEEAVTVLNQTPSAFRQLLAVPGTKEVGALPDLGWVIFGGEALELQMLKPWFEAHGDDRPRLVNMFGITETTVHVTNREIRSADLRKHLGSVVGAPIQDLGIVLMDRWMQPVPRGIPGEIQVAGAGLARGYLGRPALTASRFVPHPFSELSGERLYRSGDLARRLPDGDLEHLGRIDHQVKIRGFRIELGEIEAALAEHSGVRDAVVSVTSSPGGGDGEQRLAAYVVPLEALPGVAELREWLLARLPDYMVPAFFIPLPALPLTQNGKLDRASLPDPNAAGLSCDAGYVPPETAVQRILVEVWAEVLAVTQVGIDDNYFALGGDSIRSLRLQTRARERGIEIDFQALFQYQTVRELAAVVLELGEEKAVGQTRVAAFSLISPEDRARLPAGLEDAYPLTRLMAGMMYQSDVTADYEVYVTSLRVQTEFDPEALRQALREMAKRHEILRTSFDAATYQEPLQLVHPTAEIPLSLVDLRSLSFAEQEETLGFWIRQERRRRFSWNVSPLIRFTVHHRGESEIQLSMTEPFFDGWSVGSLLTELFQRYGALRAGRSLAADPLHAGMREFVALEQEAVASKSVADYWRTKIADAPLGRISRWPGRRVSAAEAQEPVRRIEVPISEALSLALKARAGAFGVSLKAVLLAAHSAVLAVAGGSPNVVTGLLWNGRPEIPDGDKVLGAFLNALCFRVEVGGGSWADLVTKVFASEQELLPYRRMPLAEVQRGREGEPLFDSLFNYTHFHIYRELDGLPGVKVLDASASDQTYYDLTAQFNLDHETQRLRLFLDYRPSGLGAAQMSWLASLYSRAMIKVAENPEVKFSATDLLSPANRHQLRSEWNQTVPVSAPEGTLHGAFERQARRSPGQLALINGGGQWTFDELERRANRLAHFLIRAGVRVEDRVAVCLERSLGTVAALLAVLKAGAAYVPLDATEPQERIARLVADSGARIVLTEEPLHLGVMGVRCVSLEQAWNEASGLAAEPPGVKVLPENLAWVIYTSGTTGKPKGVMACHRVTAERLAWLWKELPPAPEEVCCQKSVLSSVDAVLEVFGPLVAGVPAVVVSDVVAKDHERLLDLLATARVTRLAIVPSLLKLLADVEGGMSGRLPHLRALICSGEALPTQLAQQVREQLPEAVLWNLCGSTEASSAVFQPIQGVPVGDGSVPIGRPRSGCRVYVVDRGLELSATAVAGEMCVGGPVLARGYLGCPGKTAERFVPDPFGDEPGGRLYRSGDRARRRMDGVLEILGRLDSQVQIRGFRVEPGEVEAALGGIPGVARAAVRVWEGEGGPRLVGYVVAVADGVDSADLRLHLRQQLPDHMVPSAFVVLEEMPLLPAGKIDRRSLPFPSPNVGLDEAYCRPRNATEEVIASVWADVLGLERVGIEDDFYELGGHSLVATQVISRLRQVLDVELPLRQLFETPTVAGLASSLDLHRGRPAPPPLIAVSRNEDLPLSFAQQRLCFLDRLSPGDPVYNVPGAVRLRGALDVGSLERSLAVVVDRHEALRTSFVTQSGRSRQVIAAELRIALPVVDLSDLGEQEGLKLAWILVAEEARRPFDLGQGPLVRTALLRFQRDQHWFLPTLHHVVSDGWSHGVFVRELTANYEALVEDRPLTLTPLPVQYADFAAWQRKWLQGEVLDEQVRYWKNHLGTPPVLVLPTDRPRPALLGSAGSRVRTHIEADRLKGLRRLSLREGTTLFMTLLASFEVLLHALSRQTDLVVGTDVANRKLAETEGMIGFFVNQLVLRCDLSGNPSLRQILGRIRKVALDAYAHQDLPFEKLVEVLNPVREANRTPLFQVKFVLQNVPRAPMEAAGLEVTRLELDDGTAKFDLLFNLWEEEESVDGALEYRRELFERSTVQHMVDQYHLVLGELVERPEATLSEIRRLLEDDARRRAEAEQARWRKASQQRFRRPRPRVELASGGG